MEHAALSRFVGERFLLRENANPGPDEPLFSNGVIDSFGVMELVLKVEELYGVRLDIPTLVDNQVDSFSQLTAVINDLLDPS